MSVNTLNRPTWAEINLDNLDFNFRSVKEFVGKKLEYMAIVKADAYGHGAFKCSDKLERAGIDWFGVALPEEGFELRKKGISKPILCLGSFWLGQESLLLENDLTPVIYQIHIAERYNQIALQKKIKANVHIKIDTGMGRIGVRFDEVDNFIKEFKKFENLSIEGLMTHFAVADDLRQNDFTNKQIKLFEQAVSKFEVAGYRPKYKDLANSPGAIAHDNSHGNLIRLGGILYGLGDDVLPKEINKPTLKPIMSLHTKIAHLKKVPKGETLGYGRTYSTKKDSIVATIPIGYQDGLVRAFSNKGKVIVNNKFAPIVGRISMDWTLLDVSDIPNIRVNDEVILIGQGNGLKITAEDLAILNDTISYEITCGISRRVERIYVESK